MLALCLLFVIGTSNADSGLTMTLSRNVVELGQSFDVTFSGPDVTSDTSFDVSYLEPGYDYEKIFRLENKHQLYTPTAGTQVGLWRYTGIRIHKDYFGQALFQDLQPINVEIQVVWPMQKKVLWTIWITLEILTLPFVAKWLWDTRK